MLEQLCAQALPVYSLIHVNICDISAFNNRPDPKVALENVKKSQQRYKENGAEFFFLVYHMADNAQNFKI